ncbi:MAG: hypothetical protein IJR21_02075 [Synergistaceae bacterium]|nr:hypothetical protein [Synergistaceae bacterium]
MDYVKNNRMLSLLGQRGAFGTILYDYAQENEKIIALTADLIRASGLERFYENCPERCLNVGIAEQNAVGVAAGLADNNFIPFVTTFANFAAMRANEFVRHFMGYMNCNVKLVGLASGFAMELFGNTHYGLEDIAALRAIPNITILSPSDSLEVAKCVEFCINHNGPVYLRLSGRMNNPIVNKKDYEFKAGKGLVLNDGDDAVIYATGSMVSFALKAAAELKKTHNIAVKVVNMHTIKPFDAELVLANKDYKLILSVEEHSKIGGLGSAVAEVLASQSQHGKLIIMGTGDYYAKAGGYEYMLAQHNLTVSGIVENVLNNI